MKKLIYLIMAIAVLGLIVSGCIPMVPPVEQGETSSLMKGDPPDFFVDDDNCPGPGTGTESDPFCTIQAAINAAAPSGDTINVADGIYIITSRILVNKEVTITGNTSSPENVVVQYALPSQTLDCFDMQANDITVQGIKVVNGRYGFNFATSDPTGCTISNCVIDQCYEGAINIDGGSGHTISNNTITSCLTSGTKRGAIHIYGCPDVTIDGNTLTGNGLTGYHATMGIYVKFTYPSSSSERVEVINNNISGMLGINADIQVYDAPYTYIYNNTISNSEDKGIAIFGIDGNPAYTSAENRVQVIGNTISSTYFPGVQAANAPYTYFYNNTLTHCNYYGDDGTGDWDYASIHIDSGSANCLIDSNTVSDGINGIQLWSDDCTVTNNEIYDMGLTYANTKTTTDGTYYNSAILYGDMYDVNMPTSATISCNNIYDNYWGLFVISTYTGTVNATHNWWGHASGPGGEGGRKNKAGKIIGKGDAVSYNVDWDPWLSQPTVPPTQILNKWDLEGTFIAHKGYNWGSLLEDYATWEYSIHIKEAMSDEFSVGSIRFATVDNIVDIEVIGIVEQTKTSYNYSSWADWDTLAAAGRAKYNGETYNFLFLFSEHAMWFAISHCDLEPYWTNEDVWHGLYREYDLLSKIPEETFIVDPKSIH